LLLVWDQRLGPAKLKLPVACRLGNVSVEKNENEVVT